MKTIGWTVLEWTDERLAWKPSDFGGKDTIRINAEYIWIPDITFYNSVSEEKSVFQAWMATTNAVVFASGKVIFVPPTSHEVSKYFFIFLLNNNDLFNIYLTLTINDIKNIELSCCNLLKDELSSIYLAS